MYRILVAGLAIILTGLVGCSSTVSGTASPFDVAPAGVSGAGGASFVGTDATSVVFITWTNDGRGQLTGTAQYANVNSGYAQGTASQPLTAENVPFTGTATNGSISLHFELGSTWVGVINGQSLTVQLPQTDGTLRPYVLHVGTTADYNTAVQALTSEIEAQRATAVSQQQAAQTAQEQSSAQQDLSADLTAMSADEGTLTTTVAGIQPAEHDTANASSAADAALAAAKKATGPQADCQNLYNLVDATYTAADNLWSAADGVTAAVGKVDSALGSLNSDLDRAQKAAQAARSLGAQVPADTDTAISRANDAVTNAKSAEKQAQDFAGVATQHGSDVSAAATAVDTNCNSTG